MLLRHVESRPRSYPRGPAYCRHTRSLPEFYRPDAGNPAYRLYEPRTNDERYGETMQLEEASVLASRWLQNQTSDLGHQHRCSRFPCPLGKDHDSPVQRLPLCNIGRLLIQRCQHRACIGIKTVFSTGIPDFLHGIAYDGWNIHVFRFSANFTNDQNKPSRNGNFTSYACVRIVSQKASSTASEIWSQILSGCPSVTDSDVNKRRPVKDMRSTSHMNSMCYIKRSYTKMNLFRQEKV